MKTVKVQPLTQESFSKYGSFENLYQPQTMGGGVGTDNAFYPDVMPLGMSNASACVCHVKRRDMVVANYEFHNRAAEGVVCLDADIVIFAGFGFAPFLPPKFEAFLVPKGTLVKFKAGVLHGTQFPVDQENAAVIVLLPERTFATDFVPGKLEGEEILHLEL